MKRMARRYGPALFWQFASFATVSLPVAMLAVWLASDGTLLMAIWAIGLMAGAGAGLFMMRDFLNRFLVAAQGEASEQNRTAVPRPLRHLALSPELERPVWFLFGYGFLATAQGIQVTRNFGYVTGMVTFLVCWLLLFAMSWVWWAVYGRHPATAMSPPVWSGDDLVDAQIVPREPADGAETLTVSVSAHRSASTDEVLEAVLLMQLIPAIPGGEQRWTVRVDGEAVAVVTQTWTHPRWWPAVEWVSDPTAPFKAGQRISFTPARALENTGHGVLRFRKRRSQLIVPNRTRSVQIGRERRTGSVFA